VKPRPARVVSLQRLQALGDGRLPLAGAGLEGVELGLGLLAAGFRGFDLLIDRRDCAFEGGSCVGYCVVGCCLAAAGPRKGVSVVKETQWMWAANRGRALPAAGSRATMSAAARPPASAAIPVDLLLRPARIRVAPWGSGEAMRARRQGWGMCRRAR
jgi:hypothetical protein